MSLVNLSQQTPWGVSPPREAAGLNRRMANFLRRPQFPWEQNAETLLFGFFPILQGQPKHRPWREHCVCDLAQSFRNKSGKHFRRPVRTFQSDLRQSSQNIV